MPAGSVWPSPSGSIFAAICVAFEQGNCILICTELTPRSLSWANSLPSSSATQAEIDKVEGELASRA